jgi:hypothetical protein
VIVNGLIRTEGASTIRSWKMLWQHLWLMQTITVQGKVKMNLHPGALNLEKHVEVYVSTRAQ